MALLIAGLHGRTSSPVQPSIRVQEPVNRNGAGSIHFSSKHNGKFISGTFHPFTLNFSLITLYRLYANSMKFECKTDSLEFYVIFKVERRCKTYQCFTYFVGHIELETLPSGNPWRRHDDVVISTSISWTSPGHSCSDWTQSPGLSSVSLPYGEAHFTSFFIETDIFFRKRHCKENNTLCNA